MVYPTINVYDEDSIIYQEDMHLFQGLVQGAYIILTAAHVGFNVDHDSIGSAIKRIKVSLPSYDSIKKKMCQLDKGQICIGKTTRLVQVKVEKLKAFLDLDIYMDKEFGPCPDNDECSFEFTYESLCKLSNDELQALKGLIDRLQILICSSMFYKDFTVAFLKLSKFPNLTFLDGTSNFDISRFGTPRGRMLLAMYRATTDSTFFKSESKYYKFIKLVFIWLFNTINLISKMLKPSHKPKDDSRFYRDSTLSQPIPYPNIEIQFLYLLARYQALQAITQSFYPLNLEKFCDDLYLETMKDQSHLSLIDTSQSFDIYYRVRKVFFEILLGGVWEFKKNGWVVPTKEAILFEHPGYKITNRSLEDWFNSLMQYEESFERSWSFNFRTVGPESKNQIQDKQKFIECLRDTQKKWCDLRNERKKEVFPMKSSNKKSVNAPNLCFPNAISYAHDSSPLVWKPTIKNKNRRRILVIRNKNYRRILMNAVDMLYHNLMDTMRYSCEMCIFDLSIQKLKGNNEYLRWITIH